MKKIISIALMLALCLSLFAGCDLTQFIPGLNNGDDGLVKAQQYLNNYFQGTAAETATDYQVPGIILIDGVTYNVEWTTDVEAIVVTRLDNNMVLIDLPELAAEKVDYVLTATVSDADGKTITYSINRKIPADAGVGKTQEQIVEDAYKLADDEKLEGVVTLTGTVVRIKTPYDDNYKNITVIIQVGDLTDKHIECYRLCGDGVDAIAPGDTITVKGYIMNYKGTSSKGTVKFTDDASPDADADDTVVLVNRTPGPEVTCPATPAEVIAAAKALADGWSLPYKATMTGVVTEITTAYDSKYQNLSVKITVGDENFECYRLLGEAGADLKVGDTITVTGYMMNWKGNVQFGQGCTLDSLVPGEGGGDVEPEPEEVTVPVTDGDYVLWSPADNKAADSLADDKTYGYLNGTDVTLTDGVLSGYSDNNIFTIVNNGDGTFKLYDAAGRLVYMAGTYNSFNVTADTSSVTEGADWVLVDAGEGKVYIKNVLKNKALGWSSQYSSFGSYASGFTAMTLTLVQGTNEPSEPSEPSEPGDDDGIMSIPEVLASTEGTAVVVKGTVSEIYQAWNDQYSNISFYISDDAGNKLLVFRTGTNAKVGDKVTVTGTATLYNNVIQIAQGGTTVIDEAHVCSQYTEATCTNLAACVVCGTTTGELAGHNFVDGTCGVCGAVEGVSYSTESLSIAASAGTSSSDSLSISWTGTNFTLTAQKGTNNNAIRVSDNDHFRVYKGNNVIISGNNGAKLAKVVFTCTSNSYAEVMVESANTAEGVTATASGSVVTLVLTENVDSITYSTTAQTRINNIEVTYVPA